MDKQYKIYNINGPVITVKDAPTLQIQEKVFVGNAKLVGEVIGLSKKKTIVQVYEVTTSIAPNEPIIPTGNPMSVLLGPGILSNIYDGIQRPLRAVEAISGNFITRGIDVPSIDFEKKWDVTVTAKIGDTLKSGEIYATTPETSAIIHKCMVPPKLSGKVTFVANNGSYTVNDKIAVIVDDKGIEHTLTLCQVWPIRVPRPIIKRVPIDRPLITGQRVIDSLFPIAKGGTAAIPGGFGTGKTMTQHQLAKWSDADIIIYIGCGERGNEMTQVLDEFGELIDPKSKKPLTDRTVLIANTSNMPVAAREASVYTGITLAEYYRDMGYHVAIMADSTSRWAEALREISGRLEEMPAEEGFPAYLPSRLSQFYERAGYVDTLSGNEGSITIIGAVSPQGGDFSEPVTQNTKRFIRCFWALDKQLAYSRHYPAINWNTSYSEYINELSPWYEKNVSPNFLKYRQQIAFILSEESDLMEIVKLIGSDVLPDDQKLIIEISRVIRLGFLQQNAYHAVDTYVPLEKQCKMMEIILYLYEKSKKIIELSIPLSQIIDLQLFEKLIKMKFDIENDQLGKFDDYKKTIDESFSKIINDNSGKTV
ncbi:MAG: V-type ATP synthase subunit A [Clostridia bacterium]